MSLWSAQDAARATGGRVTGDWTATGVSIDTRTLQPGDLFVALTAARDGHDFVAAALKDGAAAALVSRVPDDVPDGAPLLVVPDVLAALEDLGRAARARTAARVVAVTGSVGKTSTKEMLRAVLSGQGRTHAAEASYNNHWGVPLTLARMPQDTQFAVIEIGMNHPGEIAPLARMARPHLAIITTVTQAHLEAFGAIEGIAREKASIVAGLEPGGIAVVNGDLDVSDILIDAARAAGVRPVTFGEKPRNHHRLLELDLHDDVSVAQVRAWRQRLLYKISVPGRHFAVNALAVMAVVWLLKLDRSIALADLGRWEPPAGRGRRERLVLDPVETHMAFELIDDAYNANPGSVAASLEVLAAAHTQDGLGRRAKGRRIAILGDMLELGPDEMRFHAAIADLPFLDDLDVVHCVGPRMRHLYDALPREKQGRWSETSEKLAAHAHSLVDAGDVVMVKGSLGARMAVIVRALRNLGQPEPGAEKGTV